MQYCPSPAREEGINVGVLLFVPELRYADIKISSTTERIRKVFPNSRLDIPQVESAKRSVELRVRKFVHASATREHVDRLIASLGNELRLLAPRPMAVSDPERQLQELFEELVGESPSRRSFTRSIPALDEALRSPRLANRIQIGQRITVPILGRELVVPYTYMNGKQNLVFPKRFSHDIQTATDSAMKLAAEGNLIAKHENKSMIVVGSLPVASKSFEDRVALLFSDFNTRYVPEHQILDFAREVERVAH